jgi:hypothetical protein
LETVIVHLLDIERAPVHLLYVEQQQPQQHHRPPPLPQQKLIFWSGT